MNYNRIKELQRKTKVTNEELAAVVEMSKVGFEKMLKLETCKVSTIELLADYFKVPISYFYDREEKEEVKAIVIPGATQVEPRTYYEFDPHNKVNDPKVTFYTCPDCIQKEEKIKDLRENINDLRKHISLLELSLGKNLKSECG